MARIISIVNQKGGTGKSACTANLAVGLAQKNMKVLIVDADPQSDVSAGFGYRDCDDSNETLGSFPATGICISGALSSAVKFCRMISSVFCFFCNSCFSRTVAACSDSRFAILFWILLELGILVTPRS